jgi:folate-binding protein YgfZ
MRSNFMLKKSFSMHRFRPSAMVRVTGEDAFEFLQGQFTNDLRGLAGGVTYGLWLNQKGKVLADSEILRISDREFVVVSGFSSSSVIIQRLEQYIIADDVVLQDQTPAASVLTVWGDAAMDLINEFAGEIPAVDRFLSVREVYFFHDRQYRDGVSFKLMGSSEAIAGLQTDLLARGGVEVSDQVKERVRIAAGIPQIPNDIGPTDLPQEAGLETAAISFTKGCYLGQEVMARLHSMGQVRRQLRRVRGSGPAPLNGTALFQGTKKMGEIRTVVATPEGFVALAMLTRLGLDENAGLALEAANGASPIVSLWTK